jgi:hypothetical protein
MKIIRFFFLPIMLVFSACEQNQTTLLEFQNPLNENRTNEVVEFTFDELEALIGTFRPDQLPLFLKGGDTLIAQFINYQGDKLPEEILVEITLPAEATAEVEVKWVPEEQYPVFPEKTSLHFGRQDSPGEDIIKETRLQTVKTEETSEIFQMEGPAWENDKVGFRNYFDLRNGMDIFGKRTDLMVLMNVGLNEKTFFTDGLSFEESYHQLSDWGMDILKVGNSLGAGAVSLEINDSLYRIGDNGFGTYEKLYEGPLRSEFRFVFPDWKANGKTCEVTHYVSITAGEFCYRSTLFLNESRDNEAFVTGIVNKHSDKLIKINPGKEHFACYTHSVQAEDTSFLGMAIMIPESELIQTGTTTNEGNGITETYFVKMETEAGKPVSYRFYAFWEKTEPEFKNATLIEKILNDHALRLENPIIIAVK